MISVEKLTGFTVLSQGAPVALAMQRLDLRAVITPAGALLRLTHCFQGGDTEALEAVYSFVLPRDATLRRFAVAGDGFRINSALRPTEQARKLYEAGVAAGSLAALAQIYADGLVNLSLGNLRPRERVRIALEMLAGVELRPQGLRFRFPFCLPPGYHAQATSGNHGADAEMQLPQKEFGDLLLPVWRDDPAGVHTVGFTCNIEMPQAIASIGSPSHPLQVRTRGAEGARVALGIAGDIPNRDLVLDVALESPWRSAVGGVDRKRKGHAFVVVAGAEMAVTVPSAPEPRRVLVVLDRSGSMSGEPIAQARTAAGAILGALAVGDEFGVLAFDNAVETFRPAMARLESGESGRSLQQAALAFLNGIDSRGGTDLAPALEAALALLQGQGTILLITDGQVFGTAPILARARALGVRIHCLGIGDASRDRFLSQLAEQTAGTARSVNLGERVDTAALELFGAADAPAATNLSAALRGFGRARAIPLPRSTITAAETLPVWCETAAAGRGNLDLRWQPWGGSATGELELPLVTESHGNLHWDPVPVKGPVALGLKVPIVMDDRRTGERLRLLDGARRIAELESHIEGADSKDELAELRRLSREYGLASQAMALVAVVKRPGDQPGNPPHTQIVPLEVPRGLALSAYFGLASLAGPGVSCLQCFSLALSPFSLVSGTPMAIPPSDTLMALARDLEPDGGMPGGSDEARVLHSLCALLAFRYAHSTAADGPFRGHIKKLTRYLQRQCPALPQPDLRQICAEVVASLQSEVAPLPPAWTAEQWAERAHGSGRWDDAKAWLALQANLVASSRF